MENRPDLPVPVFDAERGVGLLAQGIDARGESGFGGQHSRHLALVLRSGLPDERGVVNQSVFGRILLGLQSSEEG